MSKTLFGAMLRKQPHDVGGNSPGPMLVHGGLLKTGLGSMITFG